MEGAIDELSQTKSTLVTLSLDFNNVQDWINELEEKLANQDALISKEKEKNTKMLQEMIINFIGKDK